MLTDDDKKWIAAEISSQVFASEERSAAPLAGYEQRIGARLDQYAATLIAGFQKWARPVGDDSRVHEAAMRTMGLELEALRGRVENSGASTASDA